MKYLRYFKFKSTTNNKIVIHVEELNYEMYNEFDDIMLPNQVQCLFHTLNLLAVCNSNKAKIDETYKTITY